MCSELCIRAVFDRSVRQTVADQCYFPMYYSHVHSDVFRYIPMYCLHAHSNTPMYYSHVHSNSFSRTLFMLTHLTPNAVQRNAFSFVHLHSVELITARQTVADSFLRHVWLSLSGPVCMALYVWPCLYCGAHCLYGSAHTFLCFARTCPPTLASYTLFTLAKFTLETLRPT